MNNLIIFKKGQRVTISGGKNASHCCVKASNQSINPYSIPNWGKAVFTIEGTVKLVTFKHSAEIYGAYLLQYKGENIGFVYNDGIHAAKQSPLRIKAASHILVGDNIAEQLDLLDNAERCIPQTVEVCEMWECEPLANILSEIDSLELLLTRVVETYS